MKTKKLVFLLIPIFLLIFVNVNLMTSFNEVLNQETGKTSYFKIKDISIAYYREKFDIRYKDRYTYDLTAEAIKLKNILTITVNMKSYKAVKYRKKELTFCNLYARDILDNREYEKYKNWKGMYIDAYACDVSSVFTYPESVIGLSIEIAYQRALVAKKQGKIKELTMEQAQQRVNEGIPVWITSDLFTHEALVCPDFNPYDPKKGCLLAQAGRYNGIFYASDSRAFGRWFKSKDIKFYEFPMRTKETEKKISHSKI